MPVVLPQATIISYNTAVSALGLLVESDRSAFNFQIAVHVWFGGVHIKPAELFT